MYNKYVNFPCITIFVLKPFLAGKLFIENETTVDRTTICILSETWLAINDEIRGYFSRSFEISFEFVYAFRRRFFSSFPLRKEIRTFDVKHPFFAN